MPKHWMLASNREFDEGTGQACPDRIEQASPFVLRCEGGGAYAADSLSSPCQCGKPCAAVIRFPSETF